jgi:hypothetical protein
VARLGMSHLIEQQAYQSYLRRLDARALLEHYGARNATEQVNRDGTTEVIHSCLLDRVEKHHSNGDEKPSAAANVDKKTYVCYALGYGCDLFHLAQKLEGHENFADTLTAISGLLHGATLEGTAFRTELEKAFTPAAVAGALPTFFPSVLSAWTQLDHPLWAERGISDEAKDLLKLGFDPAVQRLVFPVFWHGELVGWQKRATVPDQEPKYKNSWGFPKSETLYNYDVASSYPRVCVVESPMSVAKAVSLGISNVVGTHGAKVSDLQVDALKGFEVVYLWFDRDAAGITAERKMAEGLYRHTEVMIVEPDPKKDLADCGYDEIEFKIGTAVPAAIRLGQFDRHRRLRGR